ncbi:hypothetical protein SAMN06309944_2337 [Micrococcales bacterium KH10]|nr:hypothetical protein SAMN06309944_2337 [Micrococcales bacterium KH10]
MPTSWLDPIAAIVAVGLFAGLIALRRRKFNFAVLIVIALVVGAAYGWVFRGHLKYVEPVGDIYVQIITAMVAPLIIVSILSSVTSLGNMRELRSTGVSSVFWLMLTNLIAIILTLGAALATGIGNRATLSLSELDSSPLSNLMRPANDVLLGMFPRNVVGDIASNSIVPIIIFCLMLSIAYLLVAKDNPAKVAGLKSVIDGGKAVMYKAVGFVIEVTPYAVLVLIASSTSTALSRIETVWSLVGVLVLSFAVTFVFIYGVGAFLIRSFAHLPAGRFFRKLTDSQWTAFTTQSSVGTLPLTLSALTRRIGVPESIANFTAPLGTTIGMPGCAGIWPIMVAVFAVQALGIDYSLGDYLVLVALGVLVSLGTAGVPGTAIVTATTVLTAVGLPVEVMVLLIPINAIVGAASTMANQTAAAISATIVARRQGVLNEAIFARDDDTPIPDDDAAPGDETSSVDDELKQLLRPATVAGQAAAPGQVRSTSPLDLGSCST